MISVRENKAPAGEARNFHSRLNTGKGKFPMSVPILSQPVVAVPATPATVNPAPLFAVNALVRTHTCQVDFDRLNGRIVRVYQADALHSQPAYDVMVDSFRRAVMYDECELSAQVIA